MLWKNKYRSTNVQDLRTHKPANAAAVGFVVIAATLASWLQWGPQLPDTLVAQVPAGPIVRTNFGSTDVLFVETIAGSLEIVWAGIFAANKQMWREPAIILFNDRVQAGACGPATSDIGPFYCPANNTVYLDLTFFANVDANLGIVGDTVIAYVIAHEVGHHVQTLTGKLQQVFAQRRSLPPAAANALLVRLELQADCYAGVWLNHSKAMLEPGDLAEASNSAARIGDDWLQSRTGMAVPDTFTHGTSEQRVGWLLRGWQSGNWEDCDTFGSKVVLGD